MTMFIARQNALEVAGRTARRFPVYACRVERGGIVSAELAPGPAEVLRLPLPQREAETWLWLHFEDLDNARRRVALEQVARPVAVARDLV
jgi:hypothetical protein